MPSRADEARRVIEGNAGPRGFYAGRDCRQYRVRDLVFSMEALLRLGHQERVESHMALLLDRMKPDGRVPARVETAGGLRKGVRPRLWLTALRQRGPYILRNLGQYSDPFQSWTMDSAPLALTGLRRLQRAKSRLPRGRAAEITRLKAWVDSRRDPETDLLRGAGWMDAMDVYSGRFTLCGLAVMHRMRVAWGEGKAAERLRRVLDVGFWDPALGFYRDHDRGRAFDTLAHALLLQDGAVPEERAPKVLSALEWAATRFGYLNLTPPYPAHACGQWPRVYQNSTVWPFVQGQAILALAKAGEEGAARREMRKLEALEGFGEWHDPGTGRPMGSAEQLWSAASFLQALEAVTGEPIEGPAK
ncbi:MAG: hypothetical protein QXO51_08310 [Halobacteria archaeon]